jgi:TatD DNase family protein
MLVDSHCHLDFPDFAEELDDVVQRARDAGVGVMQTICTKITEFPKVLAVAERYDNIYCSVGIHPNNVATQAPITADELVTRARHPKVIGLGETGLDFYYEHSPRELQTTSFRAHIEASRITGLPVIIHTRAADSETIALLEEEMARGVFTGLIHCFSTSRELAERSIALGLYISISGIVTFKKAAELQEIVRDLPLEKLLVETDAPYLAPVPYRGKRNEPAFTRNTAEFVAELKGVSYEEVAQVTTANFFALFRKAQ